QQQFSTLRSQSQYGGRNQIGAHLCRRYQHHPPRRATSFRARSSGHAVKIDEKLVRECTAAAVALRTRTAAAGTRFFRIICLLAESCPSGISGSKGCAGPTDRDPTHIEQSCPLWSRSPAESEERARRGECPEA